MYFIALQINPNPNQHTTLLSWLLKAPHLNVSWYINVKHLNVKFDVNERATTLNNIQLNIYIYVFLFRLLVRSDIACSE